MILFSTKKLKTRLLENRITMKQYIIYCFIIFGSIFSIIRTTKYPVDKSIYNFVEYINIIPIVVHIILFLVLYKRFKSYDIHNFAFLFIPTYAVLVIRYTLFLMLPLIIAEVSFIKMANLEFAYWNVLFSSIIPCIYSFIFSIDLFKSMKVMTKNINISI
jgi:hypothetical protein